MAVPEHTLLWLATVAAVATIGPFAPFTNSRGERDRWLQAIVGFLATLVWALVGYSANNVVTRAEPYASASESILPMIVLGFGLAALVGLVATYRVLQALADDTEHAAEQLDGGGGGWP